MSVSRRQFLLNAGLMAGFGPAVLSACGSSSSSKEPTGTTGTVAGDTVGPSDTIAEATESAVAGSKGGKVRIASWPLYIENDQDPAQSPTIKKFTKATGIEVDYKIAIDDNVSFTAKYEADLKAGRGIGYDLALPTSWMAAKWIANGWVEALPIDKIPNKVNLLDAMASPKWDPDRSKSLPFSLIQTGIAYFPDKVGFEITSFADLFKPELKGKITILSEMRDSVGAMLLLKGVNPADATLDDMLKACAELKKLRDAGQFRKITGNGYIEDLINGDSSAAMAWSGDVVGIQGDNPDVKWVFPSEGIHLSTDTFIIPKGGNPDSAAAWINFIYDPKNAGPLYEAISYGSPVKGASDSMSDAAKTSPLINPPADAKLVQWRELTDDEERQVNDAFAAATKQ
jgi:spermidine/putrescine transport system substrate-binding protein